MSVYVDKLKNARINGAGQNNGGVLGGIGYLTEKLALGTVSGFEGIVDYTVGGLAKLFGADEFAEDIFDDDWLDYGHADEWYDPSEGWKFAGDVAGGIGTSLPSIAGAVAGGAIIAASGGTAAPAGIKLIGASLAPLAAGLSGAGNATKEAFRETGVLTGKEFGYGALTGATEAGLEFLTGGIGTGTARIAKNIVKSMAKETGETITKLGAKSVFKTLAGDFVSEAFEEGLAEFLSPQYQRMTYNPDAKNATAEEIGYAALVGGLSGLVMGGSAQVVSTGSNLILGNRAVENGKVGSIMNTAQYFADFETKGETGYESFKTIKEVSARLSESLLKTNGQVSTVSQKIMLGQLQRANTAASVLPFVENSAEHIIFNADSVLESFNSLSMTDENGRAIKYTKDELLAGIRTDLLQKPDLTKAERRELVLSIRKSIESGGALSKLAVMDATGRITMSTKKFSESIMLGRKIKSADELNRFVETASPEEINALSSFLGIEDWRRESIDSINRKIDAARADGKFTQLKNEFKAKKVTSSTAAAEGGPSDLRSNVPTPVPTGNIGVVPQNVGIVPNNVPQNKNAVTRMNLENMQVTGGEYNLSDKTYSYSTEESTSILRDVKNRIATTYNDVVSFLSSVLEGKENGRLFLGKIKATTAQKIKSQTDVSAYGKSIVLSSDEIKHIFNHHGNPETEALRGQEAVTKDNFSDVLSTIFDPDSVEKSTDASGVTSLVFRKVSDGKITAVTVVSEKKKALTLKSAWITKKEQHISPPSDVQAPNQTPDSELSMNTVPKDSISRKAQNSNTFSQNNSGNVFEERNAQSDNRSKIDLVKETNEIDAWAAEKVPEYMKLSEPNRRAVRATVRQARAAGISEASARTMARVAARSGLNVVFDFEGLRVKGDDGLFDGSNTIFLNPSADGQRLARSLLLHEAGHALIMGNSGTKAGDKAIERLFFDAKKIDEKRATEIRERYEKYYKEKGLKASEYLPIVEEEVLMRHLEDVLGSESAWEYILSEDASIGQRFLSFLRRSAQVYSDSDALSSESRKLLRDYKKLFDSFAERNYQRNAFVNEKSADESGVRYSLNKNAAEELHKALYDRNYKGEVLLRDESPNIMTSQKGVKNLPMTMNASHIRENVFTATEARKLGLRVDDHTHYHGIGETFFLKIIDGLDNVKEAYRGTKSAKDPSRRENYFLLVSEFTDQDGNTINVPVYIDEHSLVNRVFIDVNKISTVFGKEEFYNYISRQIKDKNLVRIKNRNIETGESSALIAKDYGNDASAISISHSEEKSTENTKKSSGNVTKERRALREDDTETFFPEDGKAETEKNGPSRTPVPTGDSGKGKAAKVSATRKQAGVKDVSALDGLELKARAELYSDRVYSKKEILEALKEILPSDIRDGVADEIWKEFNFRNSHSARKRYVEKAIPRFRMMLTSESTHFENADPREVRTAEIKLEIALVGLLSKGSRPTRVKLDIEEQMRLTKRDAAEKVKKVKEEADVKVSVARSVADEKVKAARERAEKTVAETRAKAAEKVKKVKEEADVKVSVARSVADEKVKAARERAEKTVAETRAKADEKIANSKTAIAASDARDSARRSIARLNRRLLHPTKERNIPHAMQTLIADALSSVNMDTATMLRWAETVEEIEKLQRQDVPDYEKMAELAFKRDKIERETSVLDMKAQLDALKAAYDSFKDSEDGLARNAYDEDVAAKMEELKKIVGDTPLTSMKLEQVRAARDFYNMLLARVNNANKLFADQKKQRITDMGDTIMREISSVHVPKMLAPKTNELKLRQGERQFLWQFLKPGSVFEVIGSPRLCEVFDNLRRGEDVWARDISRAKAFSDRIKAKYHYYDWCDTAFSDVVFADGSKLRLSVDQVMSLYAYTKRVNSYIHLSSGGFVLAPDTTVKGKLNLERYVNDSRRYSIPIEDHEKIEKLLTEEQRKYADEMQAYLSKDVAADGNKVSLQLYGIKIFTEENYFPMVCASEFLDSATGKTGDVKIKNKGMTQEVQPNAKNPLVLRGFEEVWGGHVNDMALYHGMVLPMEDMNRLLNYRVDIEGEASASTNEYKTLENARRVTKMTAVANLSAKEFEADGTTSLKDRVVAFFDSFERKVKTKELGEVAVTPSSFRDDKGHGLTRNKVISFKAIPEVLSEGRVIDVYHPEGKPYTRITVAAPITIEGEKYYMGVMVQKDNQSNRMYLHDVITEKATLSFNTEPATRKSEGIRDEGHLFITSILQNALNVNNFSKNNETQMYSSLKELIRVRYGTEPIQYIEQLMRDLNGGVRSNAPIGILDKGMSLYKKTAVAANLSVTFQQPSAIARAFAVIEPKYFVAAPAFRHSAARWAELQKYAPVAIIKEMGGFDTGTGQSTASYLSEREYKGKYKIKGFVSDSDYRDKVFGYGASKADQITWIQIWEACKREQKAKEPKLAIDSDELLTRAGKRFTEVITRTQVYDSTLSRSGMMRSKDTGWKMATAFMAEPTTTMNQLILGFVRFSRDKDKKALAAVIGSILSATVINAALASLVYATRDDDEEKSWGEKYVTSFVGKTLDQINPLTMLPYVKDLWSIAQGYDVERSDMAVIADFYSAIKGFSSDKKTTFDKAWDFTANLGSIFGLPTRNIMRDFRGIVNTVHSAFYGEKGTATGYKDAFWEGVFGKTVTNGQSMYDALLSGKNSHYERVRDRFEDEDAADTALRSALRDNDKRIEKAAIAKLNGDTATYNSIIKEITAEGYFTRAFVIRAVTAEYSALRRDIEELGETAVFVDGALYKLTEEQESKLIKKRESLQSKADKLAESKGYLSLDEDQRIIADEYVQDLVEDVSEYSALGIVRGKAAIFADAIGIDKFAVFYAKTKGLESDRDSSGKAISGSKKRKVLAVINSMGGSTGEKLLMLASRGYGIQDGDIPGMKADFAKKLLISYILKIPGKTSKEKAAIAEACGFEVVNGRIKMG